MTYPNIPLPSVIVGGTSGIGAAVATALAARGGSVVIVGRDVERARLSFARHDVEIVHADLSLVSEIEALAHRLADGPALGRLVFTAGMLAKRTWRTPEGNEANFVVNHVARRRLTEAWLPRLLAADAPALGYISAWGDYKRPITDYSTLNATSGGGVWASMQTFLPNDVYFAAVAEAHPTLRVVAFNPGPTRGTQLGERAHAPLVLRVLQRVAFPVIASDVGDTATRFVRHLDEAQVGHHFFRKDQEVPAPSFVRELEHRRGVERADAAVGA